MPSRTNVPVVLALCAALMLIAINSVTNSSTVPAPVHSAPTSYSANGGSQPLEGANELLHSLAADMDLVQAHLRTAEDAINGESARGNNNNGRGLVAAATASPFAMASTITISR